MYFKMEKGPSHESNEKLKTPGGAEKFSVEEQPGEFVVSRIHIPKFKITLPYFERFFKQLLDRDTKLTRLVIRVDGSYFFFNTIGEMTTNEYIVDRFEEDPYRKNDMFSLSEVRFNIVNEHGSILFRRVAEIRGEREWVIKEREILTNFFINNYLDTEEVENPLSGESNERINPDDFRYIMDIVEIALFVLFVGIFEILVYFYIFFSSWFISWFFSVTIAWVVTAQIYLLFGIEVGMMLVLFYIFAKSFEKIIKTVKALNANGLRSQITRGKNYYGLKLFIILFVLLTLTVSIVAYVPQLEYFFTNPPATNLGTSSPLREAGHFFYDSLKFLAVYIVGTAAVIMPIILGIKALWGWWTKRGDAWEEIEELL